MTKHTPGPWHIPSHLSGADGIGPKDGYEIITCCCCGGVRGDSKEQEIANSRLIVAVPDLLDALKDMVDIAESQGHTVVKARSAIAKAEGTQP